MLGTSRAHWKKLYEIWYEKEKKHVLKLRPVINVSLGPVDKESLYIRHYKNGTNNIVYERCTDVYGNIFAMKTIKDEDIEEEWFEDSNISLFSEACIQFYLYNLYEGTNRKNRIVKPINMGLYRKSGKLCVYLAMKPFSSALYKIISNRFVPKENLESLSKSISDELDFLYNAYKFVHCDLHAGNIGIENHPNGEHDWFLFDFGMSEIYWKTKRIQAYQVDDFFDKDATFYSSFDKRVLFNSWYSYEKECRMVKDYYCKEKKNMDDTHAHEWKSGMPLKLTKTNSLGAFQGKYENTTENGVHVKISMSKRLVKTYHSNKMVEFKNASGRYKFMGTKDEKYIYILYTVNEEDVKPNFNHPHICYYFYYLE